MQRTYKKKYNLNPTVSVIIPVLNNCTQLKETLNALSEQTYPADKFEVIVVDNGSDEDVSRCIDNFTVKLLHETEQKSPYAARNKGFDASTGAIIAFTDANKTPETKWIEEGVKALLVQNADLAGGNIDFSLPVKPTASEVFDATFFNNNRNLVMNEQAAVTGNLFLKRDLMDTIGRFHGMFRSGMDIWWTQQAVRKGCKLIFAENSIVICKPRRYSALLKKSRRVGISHPFIRREAGDSLPNIALTVFRTFAPPGFRWLKENVSENYGSGFLIRLWMVAWSYKCCLGIGRLQGLLTLNKIRKKLK